ncbi:MAG: hypothetical protein H6905_05220, partial [Hyphomicrobiales bacterium]|nr:hypothetical protein [Hyphomicrobiales bacterium]
MLKRIFPRGLMARALLIVLGPFLIMQVLSSYVFYENHWDQVGKQLARDLAGDVAMLIDVLSQSSGQEEQDSWLRKAGRLFDLAVTIEDGGVLPETPKELTQLEGELRRALFFKGVSSPFRIDSQSIPGVVVIALQ